VTKTRSEPVAEHSAALFGCEERVRYSEALVDTCGVRPESVRTRRVVPHSAWVKPALVPAALDERRLQAPLHYDRN